MPYHRTLVNTLPTWGVVGVLFLFFMTVAFVSYFAIRRFYPKLLSDRMSPSFGVIGGAVAFLLGFTISRLWQNYSTALQLTLNEASNFYTMLSNIKKLNPIEQQQLNTAIQNYLTILRDKEWPSMRLGVNTSEGWNAFNKIYDVIGSFTTNGNYSGLTESISKVLDNIAIIRLARMETIDPLLNIELILIIILGACYIVFTVANTSADNMHNHFFSIIVACFLVSINMTLVLMLTYPFSGDYAVKGKALLFGMPGKLKQLERENKKALYAEQLKVIKSKIKPPETPKAIKPEEQKKGEKGKSHSK